MSQRLPPAMLLADARGLDFLNSIAVPVDVQVEWLGSREDLLSWLKQAELVTPNVLRDIRKSAGPGELDAVAAHARALREWFRSFIEKHEGAPLTSDAVHELEPLNRLLGRDEAFGQVVAREHMDEEAFSSLEWLPQRRWRSPDSLLLPIAHAMAELVTSSDFSQIKQCEGAHCTLRFLDTTGGKIRRWCSMSICGNRAKQAAHRERAAKSKGKKEL